MGSRISGCTFAFVVAAFMPSVAHAIGDASTQFGIYTPANNMSSRPVYLIVTNVSSHTATVDIIDDAADGDDDDTVEGVSLPQGGSAIVRIRDGAVNDDAGGTGDGDFFRVFSSHPVIVQTATRSNWQHDWAAAAGGGARGNSFFLYAPPTSGADNDLNVFAYQDDTQVTVRRVSTASVTTTGTTQVDLEGGEIVLNVRLNEGEDLIHRNNGLGLDILDPGHTYWLQADRGVTVQYGHLGQLQGGNQARDGAGYVPSSTGYSTGPLFYFAIPHNPGLQREKELRVVCADPSTISLYGATAASTDWTLLSEQLVADGGHLDFVGSGDASFRDHDLYRLQVDPPYHRCTVFEGNWMETGSYGTSDFASAVSSVGGENTGYQFVAYMGPPGNQRNTTHPSGEDTNVEVASGWLASHLYVFSAAAQGAGVTVRDLDSAGEIFEHTFAVEASGYYDVVIETDVYQQLTSGGRRPYLEVLSDQPVMVMNGNFNDNWMAHFHSNLPKSVEPSFDSDVREVSCGDTVDVTVRCTASAGATGDVSVALTLPPEVGYVTGSSPDASVSAEGRVLWDAPVPAGGVIERTVSVEVGCDVLACLPVAPRALELECRLSEDGQPNAELAVLNWRVTEPGDPTVAELTARDVPDYAGSPPSPRTRVEIDLQGASAQTQVQVWRSVDSGDDDAPRVLVGSYDGSQSQIVFEDPYPLHFEQTRFYRVDVVEGECNSEFGPVAVRTSSGQSAGEDSGLESNGRLASKLARRAIARSKRAGWVAPNVERSASSESAAEPLTGYLPLVGPAQAAPVNVTPSDLPELTNAQSVAAADYLLPSGERVASALIVETESAAYEHSKALCDRAAGGYLRWMSRSATPQGEVLRMATENAKRGTGEYSVEVRLFETGTGWKMHCDWTGGQPIEAEPGQRVLAIQAWSSRPGYDLTLLEDIVGQFEVQWPDTCEPPAAYFAHVGTLGGYTRAIISGDPTGMQVRVTALLETGETLSELYSEPPTEFEPVFSEPFADITVELLDGQGNLVDTVWASDGAWAVIDDSMWGGATEVEYFDDRSCPELPSRGQGELAFSGCASLRAEVAQFAGVARHIGGAFAPLSRDEFTTASFWLESSEEVRVCLEGADSEHAGCVVVDPQPEGQWLTVDLGELIDTEQCERWSGSETSVVTFTTAEPGPQLLTVRGLSFGNRTEPRAPTRSPCDQAGASPSEVESGCACTADGQAPGARWLLWLLVPFARRFSRLRGAGDQALGRNA